MSRVSIIGLGHIGMNILETFAQAGVDTVGVETDESSIARGLERSKSNLSGLVKKGKITPERQDDILSKMKVSGDLQDIRASQFVIEAIFEDIGLKKDFQTGE
jgi:3-hydroxyacyl-CoA dehydrogenase